MGQHKPKQLVKKLGITYVVLVLALSYFAIYPSWRLGEADTLLVTMIWMLILAAIVSVYAMAVVYFGGDEDPDRPNA